MRRIGYGDYSDYSDDDFMGEGAYRTSNTEAARKRRAAYKKKRLAEGKKYKASKFQKAGSKTSKKKPAAKKKSESKATGKRKPTAYNLFVKKTMKELVMKYPKMAPTERMKKIGMMWKKKKLQKYKLGEQVRDITEINKDLPENPSIRNDLICDKYSILNDCSSTRKKI